MVKTEIEVAFTQLKTLLTKEKCEITAENAPLRLSALQGSIWGFSPKTAKKTLTFQFFQTNLGTHISSASALSSDYVRLTAIGYVFAVVLTVFCFWIYGDLNKFSVMHLPGIWGWLINTDGYTYAQNALLLSEIARICTALLVFMLAVETVVLVYVKRHVGKFAMEILSKVTEG